MTTGVLPAVAARCSGVTPVVLVRASTAAPAPSSAFTASTLPERLARWSGVYWPMRVTAPGLAPA